MVLLGYVGIAALLGPGIRDNAPREKERVEVEHRGSIDHWGPLWGASVPGAGHMVGGLITFTPTGTPTPEPTVGVLDNGRDGEASSIYVTPVAGGAGGSFVQAEFVRGAVDGGAGSDLLSRLVLTVGGPTSGCTSGESGWQLNPNPSNGYFGLGQWLPSTWALVTAITGLGDWMNPYHQGYNMAVWAMRTDPTTQWPTCWPR